MTSQPLLATVCVDYLSHPLSTEHLLVCYQQITRQIAHAPVSAKDAAISFQHQSQALLELLGQHQNLAIPSTKERPAPVGCQSQLKRMQNALWRRSSQSSLAKDVALVHPESLNWQKECDVLWLYGPLYEVNVMHQHNYRSQAYRHLRRNKGPGQGARATLPLAAPALAPPALAPHRNGHGHERVHFQHISPEQSPLQSPQDHSPSPARDSPVLSSPPLSPPATAAADAAAAAESAAPTTAAVAATESHAADNQPADASAHAQPPILDPSSERIATGPSSSSVQQAISSAPSSDDTKLPLSEELPELSLVVDPATCPIDSDPLVESPTSTTTATTTEQDESSNALVRPAKPALKQQATRTRAFEELRAFTSSPEYLALATMLTTTTSDDPSSPSSKLAITEGSRSEPLSPIVNQASPTFLLPIFPSPTKYHFRAHDRRRASFPKSASHPSHLNINVSVNMNMSLNLKPNQQQNHRHHGSSSSLASSSSSTTLVDGEGPGQNGSSNNNGNLNGFGRNGLVSAKQLRFSLEVQELVFLPTSPPFRISRAKPTRAHSDPAIQTATCSSFIAPSLPTPTASAFYRHQNHHLQFQNGSTLPSPFENSTTTTTAFIKVQAADLRGGTTTSSPLVVAPSATAGAGGARTKKAGSTSGSKSSKSSSAARLYLPGDDDEDDEDDGHLPECGRFYDEFHDEFMFQDCRERRQGANEDGEEEEDEDEQEDDEFNGVGTGPHHRHHQYHRFRPTTSKDLVVARQHQQQQQQQQQIGDDQPQQTQPGVLWQVYTAVTGVKELIAWYGSMVYHSSSM